jgi:predicted RNA binding protein YcfA (HicA-like mRNA interferase family)
MPVISADEFVWAKERLGYTLDRMRGSHMILICPSRPRSSVPRHRELDRGTVRGLLRDAGVSVEELTALLKK